jgi:hypothetical protein
VTQHKILEVQNEGPGNRSRRKEKRDRVTKTHDTEEDEKEQVDEEESRRGGRQGRGQPLDTKKVTQCMEDVVKTAAVLQYVLLKCVAPRRPQALSRFVKTAAVLQYVLF